MCDSSIKRSCHIKRHGIIKRKVAFLIDPDELIAVQRNDLIIRKEHNSQRALTRRNIKKISLPNYSNELPLCETNLCQRIGKRKSKFGKCKIKKLRIVLSSSFSP
jgi:hypothetical protein